MSDVHKRNLAVPFFTQRDNTYVWQQISDEDKTDKNGNYIKKKDKPFGPKYPMAWRTCNITSLCMILHYWGLTEETPNQMVEKIFAKKQEGEGANAKWGWSYEATVESGDRRGAARLENWSDLKKVAELYIEGKEEYKVVQGGAGLTVKLLKDQISKGVPVIISTGLGSAYNSGDTGGHIVVVRGFTDDDHVILNDPFGIPVNNDNRIRQSGTSANTYGWYYLSNAASIGDNIIIHKEDFEARYAKDTSKYLYIEGPFWQEPGGSEKNSINSYPIRSNNMWHDGIHLESSNGFYSIGSGRLIAARNAEVENHGSNSFALVKYQLPNQEKKFFYALYMHLKKIDLKKELSDFILHKQGNVSKELKGIWYEQILSNLLPYYKIINNTMPKKIDSSSYNKIYKAKFNGYKLQSTNELADVFSVNGILSRHFKLYLLPAKPDLIKKISDIENYNNFATLKFMIKGSDSDFKDENGYYYFFCGNNGQRQLCCCKNVNEIFAGYNFVNEASYKYYLELLYKLYKGETVSFNKIDTKTKNDKLEKIVPARIINDSVLEFRPIYYSNSKFLLGVQSKRGFGAISIEQTFQRVKRDIQTVVNDIEYIFITFVETGKSASKNELEKYIDAYITKRKAQLESFLKEVTRVTGSRNVEFGSIEKKTNADWMKELFEDAEKRINAETVIAKKGNYDTTKGLDGMCDEFKTILYDYQNSDLINSIAICEFLMIEFASLPNEKLTKKEDRLKFTSFEQGDTFKDLYKQWDKLLKNLKASYLDFFKQRYIDNYIEIPKGVKIGDGSDIPDTDGKEKNAIHFEIFSKDKLIEGESLVEDDDEDEFYDPSKITEKILAKMNDEDKKTYAKYASANVLTKKEIEQLYKQTNLFKTMVTKHRSEWKSKNYTENDISKIANKYTKINSKDKKELIKTLKYYNDYYNSYNWLDSKMKDIVGDDKFYYYQPLYFIEQISKSE